MRVTNPSVPVDWEVLWQKMVRWFYRGGVPVWARMWFQNMRSQYEKRRKATKTPTVAELWNTLSPATKVGWDDAAEKMWGYRRGYRLFTSDFIYRQKANLSPPQGAMVEHQLFGLRMQNLDGVEYVRFFYDTVYWPRTFVGPFNIKVSYKKDEIEPSSTEDFIIHSTGFYDSNMDVDHFVAPDGDVAWNIVDRNFGVTDRVYNRFAIAIHIGYLKAKIWIDNIILSDKNGEFYHENFDPPKYAVWEEPVVTLQMMYEGFDDTETGDGADAFFGSSWRSQIFTPQQEQQLRYVYLKLARSGSPGTVTVGIREVDDNNHPMAADLVSATADGNLFTEDINCQYVKFDFGAGIKLMKDKKYAIVVRAPDGSLWNHIYWRLESDGSIYPRGNSETSTTSGMEWTIHSEDYLFQTYSDYFKQLYFWYPSYNEPWFKYLYLQ